MAFPIIAYDSMLRLTTTTVTDPGTETGFSITALYDLKAYQFWKSNQTAAAINIDIDTGAGGKNGDYIALVNHNLFTLGATVRVLADTVSPAAVQVMAATALPEDTVSLLTFTAPGAKRYWRITINHAALPFASKPYAAEIFLGMKTTLPEYLAPSFDPFFKGVEVSGNRSEGGHFLAATTRGQSHRGTLNFGGDAGIVRSFFTSDLNAFLDTHALLRRPFIFTVDTADTDFDSARYVKMPDDADAPRLAVGGSHSGRLTFSLPVEEAFMETA